MGYDDKVSFEVLGVVLGLRKDNGNVIIRLKTSGNITVVYIPRKFCNSKKIHLNDLIKINGSVCEMSENKFKNTYTVIFATAQVQKILGNGTVNNKFDFVGEFSFIGTLDEAEYYKDDEFYKIFFRHVEAGEIHTVYMDKESFENALENVDFRRLLHIVGKTTVVTYHKHFYEIPISKVKNFATKIEAI